MIRTLIVAGERVDQATVVSAGHDASFRVSQAIVGASIHVAGDGFNFLYHSCYS